MLVRWRLSQKLEFWFNVYITAFETFETSNKTFELVRNSGLVPVSLP